MLQVNGPELGRDRELACLPRTVLVVCATHRDHRELKLLGRGDTEFIFHDYAGPSLEALIGVKAGGGREVQDPLAELERMLAEFGGGRIDAVVSTDDYPGSALAAVIAKELGFPGPEPRANLICQHKYLSRVVQAAHVPEAVPPFALIDVADVGGLPEGLCFPVFVKPVKSFFSIGAGCVASEAELAALKADWAMRHQFFLPIERLLQLYVGTGIGTKRLIAEGPLRGVQVTVEGYVFQGEATILGVVDTVMFPGTLAFARFEYPSALPGPVQTRMAEIATRAMLGLDFDNCMFNIEMMYDSEVDLVSIIEINPRMASQFADLYEKVDGTNAYEILLDIAFGLRPEPKRRQGPHLFAASCVLRAFEDCRIGSFPSKEEIERLALDPDTRVELHGAAGRLLSEEMNDGRSYRYGIINLGGRDRSEVLRKFEACRAMLGITLLPLIDNASGVG
jgi:hypothetical protein